MKKNKPFILLLKGGVLWSLVALYCHGAVNETLYLTATLNGQPIDGLVKAKNNNNVLYIAVGDARRLNIKTSSLSEEKGYVEFRSQPGLDVSVDKLSQSLTIVASTDWLGRKTRLNNSNGSHFLHSSQLSPSVKGVAVNYNVFTSHEDGIEDTSMFGEFRTLGLGPGIFSTSFNTREAARSAGDASGTRRLMSSWSYQNMDRLLTLSVGDSDTPAQTWSNSVRFGGIKIAHNYTTQPDFNTSSQDILTDTVTLPSKVDLYVQGIKTSSQNVQPGQFTLNTAPVFTGSGGAQVVITDINGQQRVVNLNLYGTRQLLSRGLNTWGLSAGWVRKDCTYKSFSYDSEFVGTGDWRDGITDKTTIEAHTEQSGHLHNQGVGWNYLLSPATGLLHANISTSHYDANRGARWGAGWQWNDRQYNVSLDHAQSGSGYRDISSMADNMLTREEDSAFASVSLENIGTIGVSIINQVYSDDSSRYLGLSWSKSFTRQINLSSSITHAMDNNNNTTVYINFSIPLNHQDYGSIEEKHDSTGNSIQASLVHSLKSNRPGWGWDLSALQGKRDNAHASLQHRSHWSDLALGYNHEQHDNNAYASVSGAVGLFMGHIYATRELGSAFALVDTSGVANIPVLLEHRPVGKTDKNGMLFLNNLNPYQENRIDINVLGLAEDYRAPYTNDIVIPQTGRGGIARFSLYRTHAVLLSVKTADGRNIPFSSLVNVFDAQGHAPPHGTQRTIAGYGGNIYLESPPAGGSLLIKWDSASCRVNMPAKFASSHAMENINALCQ